MITHSNLRRLVVCMGLALGACALGCAADTSDDANVEGDDATGEQDVVGTHQYRPVRVSATWSSGCGIAPPGQTASDCMRGLIVDVQRRYGDLEVRATPSVDDATRTITVKVETFSKGPSKRAPRPAADRIGLGIPIGTRVGATYAIRLVSHKGAVLWSGSVETRLAP